MSPDIIVSSGPDFRGRRRVDMHQRCRMDCARGLKRRIGRGGRCGQPPRILERNMTGLYCQPPWTTMLTTGFFSSACRKVYS